MQENYQGSPFTDYRSVLNYIDSVFYVTLCTAIKDVLEKVKDEHKPDAIKDIKDALEIVKLKCDERSN